MNHRFTVTAEIDGKVETKKYLTANQARKGLARYRANLAVTSAYLLNDKGTTLEGFGPVGRNYK